MPDLNYAVQLIRQGQNAEAQQILQTIIKVDPKNVQAWFWYVETCATTEKRIQTLEMCLKMNPANVQVTQALQMFRAQQPMSSIQSESVKTELSPASTFSYYEEDQKKEFPSTQNDDRYGYGSYGSSFEPSQAVPLYEEEKPSALVQNDYGYESYEIEPAQSKSPPKQQWELEYESYVDKSRYSGYSKISKPSEKVRTYNFFEVWLTAITVQDHVGYADLLDDPKATLGRAFTWIALASLVNIAIVPVFMLMNPQIGDFAEMSVFMFSMIIAAPIGGVISFAILAGIQNIFALGFGGHGYYTRTAYALAAYSAPLMIVTSLLLIVPIVGQCLAIPIVFYNLVLNIRALRASHSLSTLTAFGVIIGPSIFMFIFVCLALILGGINLPSF